MTHSSASIAAAPEFSGWRYAAREAAILGGAGATWAAVTFGLDVMATPPIEALASLGLQAALDAAWAAQAPAHILGSYLALRVAGVIRHTWPEASDKKTIFDAYDSVAFMAGLGIVVNLVSLPWGRLFG